MNKEIQAVIFDLDGTLINSEPNYFKADQTLANEVGLEFTIETHHNFIGIGSERYVNWLMEQSKTSRTKEALLKRKDDLYMQFARENTSVFPQMRLLLEKLTQRNFPMAVATGSTRPIMSEMLQLSELARYFSIAISTQDVAKGKPDPAVFLEAAKQTAVRPANCLVLEDSKYGVQGAVAAGMSVAGIPSLPGKLDEAFNQCDLLFPEGQSSFNAESILEYINNFVSA